MICLVGVAHHFLIDCPLMNHVRLTTIHQIPNLTLISSNKLLQGDTEISFQENKEMFEKIQEFISLSGRFP